MTIRILVALCAVCILCSSCVVQSLNPFYTKDILIHTPPLTGIWKTIPQDATSDNKIYLFKENTVLCYDEYDFFIEPNPIASSTYQIVYFKLQDNVFADCTVGETDDFTRHILLKIQIESNTIKAYPLNPEHIETLWFSDELQKNKTLPLPYITMVDTNYVYMQQNTQEHANTIAKKQENRIYMPPSQAWILFLEKYRNNKEAFTKEPVITLVQETASEITETTSIPQMIVMIIRSNAITQKASDARMQESEINTQTNAWIQLRELNKNPLNKEILKNLVKKYAPNFSLIVSEYKKIALQ